MAGEAAPGRAEGEKAPHLGEALGDIEQALPRFARWMYSTVRGALGESVLDAGAGIGTHTELLLQDGRSVVALEAHPLFAERLRQKFEGNPKVAVYEWDLAHPEGLPPFAAVDSALCLNVLEHILDDVRALRNIRDRVRPGGALLALVPAYPWLYNTLDRAIGHERRYTRSQFLRTLEASGWSAQRCFYFNVFGIPGWFVSGSVLRRTNPGRDLTRLYDALIPVLSRVERALIRGRMGLSLVAVCRRSEDPGPPGHSPAG